jgi:hypothetical protein
MITRSDLLLVAALVALTPGRALADEPPPASSSDTLDPLRERFRTALEKYRAGAFAEAIVIWSAIYTELGPEKGYRVAFNLAEAYDQLGGSASQAAEYYEVYLKEVERRRARGETLEPIVEKQEGQAKDHLAEIAKSMTRLEIVAEGRGATVRIDDGPVRIIPLVAYITPRKPHALTWNPGTAEERRVEMTFQAGTVSIGPPRIEQPPPPPPPRFETRTERPFSATWLYVGAGVTALSTIVPIVLYANASSARSDLDSKNTPDQPDPPKNAAQALYDDRRDSLYLSYALPAVFGAATLGLFAYWLWAGKEVQVPVTAAIGPSGGSISAHF